MKNQFRINAILMACIAFLTFSGCSTQKKEISKLHRLNFKYPNELAKDCFEKFPVQPTKTIKGKTDTVIKTDTVTKEGPRIPCPPAAPGKTVYVDCPPSKQVTKYVDRFRTDTVFLKDNAEVQVITNNYSALRDSFIIVKQQLKQSEDAKKQKNKWLLILGGLLIASIGLTVLKFLGRV